MAGFETRGRRDPVPKAPDFTFVVFTVIVAIAAIFLSIAMGVPTPPEIGMFMG